MKTIAAATGAAGTTTTANRRTDKLVQINRVAKVVKGGRNFQFAALVVVGDGKRPGRLRTGQGARGA